MIAWINFITLIVSGGMILVENRRCEVPSSSLWVFFGYSP